MINVNTPANALELGVSLVLLVIILFKLLQSVRLDEFRQEMFAIRDDLFDFAASGNISFCHPAYELLRRLMNGHIRYAHHLTFFSLCLTLLDWRFASEKPKAEWVDNWASALETIDDNDVRMAFREFHAKTLAISLKRIIFGSPILMLAVAIVTLGMVVRKGLRSVEQAAKNAPSVVIRELIDPQLIEEEAARCAA